MKKLILLLLFLPSMLTANPINYTCSYNNYSDTDGNHKASNPFILNFIVDKDTGKSYLLGNNGTADVVLIEGEGKISFVEITGTGNVMTTTIGKTMESVHSRNMIMFGDDFIPSQYYGRCEIK